MPPKPVLDSIVALLIARDGERAAIQTITSFAEAAHYPASVWVSVSRRSAAHELIESTGRFSLAVLSCGQARLARSFRETARETDRAYRRVQLYETDQGFLFASRSLACTGCLVAHAASLGDNTQFFADIQQSHCSSSLFKRRQLLASEL